MKTRILTAVSGLLIFAGGSAWAQTAAASPNPTEPPPTPPENPTEPPASGPNSVTIDEKPATHPDLAPVPPPRAPTTAPSYGTSTRAVTPTASAYPSTTTRLGAGVLLGAGVEDFTSSSLRGMTGVGGTWDARAVAGTRRYFGVEAAYVGSARNINALGLGSNAGLVSNGVEGALRVNLPLPAGRSLIEPFGFVGLGWQHYTLTNTDVNTSDLANSDDVMTVPYGGGLEYATGMFMADARFTFRQTYQNDLLRTTAGGRLNNWGVGAKLGVQF